MANEIETLIQLGEGYHLEYKENIDKSLVKEICAFANADGGTLLIGVTDKQQIKAIKCDNRLMSQIQDSINQIDPKIKVSITPVNGILIIKVPRGTQKPYGCADGFFLRVGANSQKLTRNEIISMLQREGVLQFDSLENTVANFETDFDQSAFNNFLEKSKISPSITPLQLLKNLEFIHDGILNNTGALFFTKSIEFSVRQAVCTCILFKGIDRIHIIDRKDFSSNMLDNIENAISFVKRHTNLEYKIERLQREDIPEIPEIALREAIVNAFCHKYYFERGSNIMIEVYDDRVAITSFGGLPVGLNESEFGVRSVLRNPLIADLLQRANYIEKAGTGIQRIKDAVNALGKGTVEFRYNDNWFDVIFSRVRVESSVKSSLKSSLKIIELIEINPNITILELAQQLNISTRAVAKHIKILKNANQLERIGADKGGYWKIK